MACFGKGKGADAYREKPLPYVVGGPEDPDVQLVVKLRAEIERLQGYFAKLSKTAGGVPLHYDQPVWVWWGGQITNGNVIEVRRDGALVGFGMRMRNHLYKCEYIFDTHEAAEAKGKK